MKKRTDKEYAEARRMANHWIADARDAAQRGSNIPFRMDSEKNAEWDIAYHIKRLREIVPQRSEVLKAKWGFDTERDSLEPYLESVPAGPDGKSSAYRVGFLCDWGHWFEMDLCLVLHEYIAHQTNVSAIEKASEIRAALAFAYPTVVNIVYYGLTVVFGGNPLSIDDAGRRARSLEDNDTVLGELVRSKLRLSVLPGDDNDFVGAFALAFHESEAWDGLEKIRDRVVGHIDSSLHDKAPRPIENEVSLCQALAGTDGLTIEDILGGGIDPEQQQLAKLDAARYQRRVHRFWQMLSDQQKQWVLLAFEHRNLPDRDMAVLLGIKSDRVPNIRRKAWHKWLSTAT